MADFMFPHFLSSSTILMDFRELLLSSSQRLANWVSMLEALSEEVITRQVGTCESKAEDFSMLS